MSCVACSILSVLCCTNIFCKSNAPLYIKEEWHLNIKLNQTPIPYINISTPLFIIFSPFHNIQKLPKVWYIRCQTYMVSQNDVEKSFHYIKFKFSLEPFFFTEVLSWIYDTLFAVILSPVSHITSSTSNISFYTYFF